MPLVAQDEQELSTTLIEQRIAALRDAGAADSDETLRNYEAAQSWLNSAAAHTRDAARFVAELTEAPRREAMAQDRLDAMEFEDVAADNLEAVPREDLEAELLLTQSELRAANENRDLLDRRLAARENNAGTARARLAEIAARLAQMPDQTTAIDPAAPPSLTEANQWLQLAELTALREERRALSAQLESQPGRYSALHAERAEIQFNIERLTRRASALAARSRSKRSSPAVVEPLDLEAGTPAYVIGARYQARIVELNARERALENRLAKIKVERELVERATRVINERFTRAKRMVQFATQSEEIGGALLASWRELENLRLDSPSRGIPRQVGDMVISRIHHEEELAGIVSASAYLNTGIIEAGLNPKAVQALEREILLKLVRVRRDLLRNIIAAESGGIDALSDLEDDYARHAARIAEYQDYLEPLVLWIPSSAMLWKTNFSVVISELPALARSIQRAEVSLQPAFFVSVLLALGVLLSANSLRRYQLSLNRFTTRPREDSIIYTLMALVISALRSTPPALFVIALASLFAADDSASAVALTEALNNLLPVLFAVTLLRRLCEENGVAGSHFRWKDPSCEQLKRETRWFMFWLLPVATIAGFLHQLDDAAALLGRLAMLGTAVMLMLHFSLSLWKDIKQQRSEALSANETRIRFVVASISIAVVFGLVIGLRHSASVVIATLLEMLTAGIALAIVHSFLVRWLQVVRKRLRFTELVAARQERTDVEGSELGTIEEEKANLSDIGEESRQLLSAATIVAALSILAYLWAPIFPIFDAMSGITLWTSTSIVEGETMVDRITLDILVIVVLLAGITLYTAQKLPALLELVLRSRTDVSAGARYTTSTLLNYLIIGTGFLVALSTLGLDWSKLQWLIAALGVGIGFGLQEVVANFICGLIILFERPISVGNIITVGDKDGFVTKIRIRATTIRDWDNKELLIPNKEIVTGRLLNWSLSDTQLRLSSPVGITYDSDVVLAIKILGETVAADERILRDPEPSIIFSGFGDNSLDLVCRYYIDSIDNLWPVRTALHLEIFRRFTEAGIVIAFPQRDVHLDSAQPLRIAMEQPSGAE
jgi:potassium efflux system protein